MNILCLLLLAFISPMDHESYWSLLCLVWLISPLLKWQSLVQLPHTKLEGCRVAWLLAFLRSLVFSDFWYKCSSNPARPSWTVHFQVRSDTMVSKNHLATRVKEHRQGHSAIQSHLDECCTCRDSYSSDLFSIIDSGSNDFDIMIKEAMHIKSCKSWLNKQLSI